MATRSPKPGSYRSPSDPAPVAPVAAVATPDIWITYRPVGSDEVEQRWPLWVDEITPFMARKVRVTTGVAVGDWLDAFATNPKEIDAFAVALWVTRMVNGERDLTLDDIEAGMKYGDDHGIEPGTPVDSEGDDSPEA